MSDSPRSSGSGGISFVGLLTVAFIVLKLTDYLTWSWWWVLSPLWISAVVGAVALAALSLVAWRADR